MLPGHLPDSFRLSGYTYMHRERLAVPRGYSPDKRPLQVPRPSCCRLAVTEGPCWMLKRATQRLPGVFLDMRKRKIAYFSPRDRQTYRQTDFVLERHEDCPHASRRIRWRSDRHCEEIRIRCHANCWCLTS